MLNIAVWGAVIAYLLQMVSFIILRRKFPNAKRPYRQPVGHRRAPSIAGVIAALIFVGFLINRDVPAGDHRDRRRLRRRCSSASRSFGRHRLVLSPEEEYALSGGEHGDPQAEGYDAMETEVFGDEEVLRARRRAAGSE